MSMSPPKTARAPVRRRGYIRVAAIMRAGVEVFAEKGYDAATMTEIAARSGTAIASLYRFFPSKDCLADALLAQYAQHVLEEVTKLGERTARMSPDDLADALIALRLELQSERRFAVGLADSRGAGRDKRLQFRRAWRSGLERMLRTALPHLGRAKAGAMAMMVLHLLKVTATLDEDPPATRRKLLAETRQLLRLYLASAAPS